MQGDEHNPRRSHLTWIRVQRCQGLSSSAQHFSHGTHGVIQMTAMGTPRSEMREALQEPWGRCPSSADTLYMGVQNTHVGTQRAPLQDTAPADIRIFCQSVGSSRQLSLQQASVPFHQLILFPGSLSPSMFVPTQACQGDLPSMCSLNMISSEHHLVLSNAAVLVLVLLSVWVHYNCR